MVTLEQTLQDTHDWVIDRLHTLCDETPCITMEDAVQKMEDAHALRNEFAEWLNPSIDDHDIYSLEFIGEDHGGDSFN